MIYMGPLLLFRKVVTCLFVTLIARHAAAGPSQTSGENRDQNHISAIWKLDRVTEINCSWHFGDIRPPDVEFEVNGKKVTRDARHHLNEMGDNRLQLHIVDPEPLDSGIYRCKAVIRGKSVVIDNWVLTVLVKPTANDLTSNVLKGTNATLRCPIDASHESRVVIWLNSAGEPLHNGRKYVINKTLTILDIDFSDSGMYKCFVYYDKTGRTEGNVTIQVLGSPNQPQLYTNFDSSSSWNKVVIWWRHSFNGGSPIVGSFLTCRGQEEQLDVETMTFSSSTTNVSVMDVQLQNNRTYICSLQSINAYGYSAPSNSIQLTFHHLYTYTQPISLTTAATASNDSGRIATSSGVPTTSTKGSSVDRLKTIVFPTIFSALGIVLAVVIAVRLRLKCPRVLFLAKKKGRNSTPTMQDLYSTCTHNEDLINEVLKTLEDGRDGETRNDSRDGDTQEYSPNRETPV